MMQNQNQIIVLTPEQLTEIVSEATRNAVEARQSESDNSKERHYVYGLRGIRELFGVSHPTAQRYKNTFLAPAVMQRGRKIIVDVDKAMQLYNENA